VGGLENFLNSYVPGRWQLIDPPDYFRVGLSCVGVSTRIPRFDTEATLNTVNIRVTSLRPEEKVNIEAFLDWFLGADLAYVVSPTT